MDDSTNIEEVFHSAVTVVRNLPKEGPIKPSDGLKLKLYAYFKQATHGPNDTPKPRFYQIVEGYKWDAWYKLEDMSKTQAMMCYVKELKGIMDTIPEDERDLDADIEAKPFYDYCLGKGSWDRMNLNKSNSSRSSVSMLDAGGDADDQLAVAILRLQRGLEETNKRLSKIEGDLINKVRLQTSESSSKATAGSMIKSMKAIHWFYLGYPFIVYFVIRALTRRKRQLQS